MLLYFWKRTKKATIRILGCSWPERLLSPISSYLSSFFRSQQWISAQKWADSYLLHFLDKTGQNPMRVSDVNFSGRPEDVGLFFYKAAVNLTHLRRATLLKPWGTHFFPFFLVSVAILCYMTYNIILLLWNASPFFRTSFNTLDALAASDTKKIGWILSNPWQHLPLFLPSARPNLYQSVRAIDQSQASMDCISVALQEARRFFISRPIFSLGPESQVGHFQIWVPKFWTSGQFRFLLRVELNVFILKFREFEGSLGVFSMAEDALPGISEPRTFRWAKSTRIVGGRFFSVGTRPGLVAWHALKQLSYFVAYLIGGFCTLFLLFIQFGMMKKLKPPTS